MCFFKLRFTPCMLNKKKKKKHKKIKHTGNLFTSCTRKETVDINILAKYKNGDRKIMQSIRITSRPPRKKRNTS